MKNSESAATSADRRRPSSAGKTPNVGREDYTCIGDSEQKKNNERTMRQTSTLSFSSTYYCLLAQEQHGRKELLYCTVPYRTVLQMRYYCRHQTPLAITRGLQETIRPPHVIQCRPFHGQKSRHNSQFRLDSSWAMVC